MPPQLEQEVERRQRLGPESAARKALIANSYRPARLEIYNPLQDVALAPEFLAAAEYSTLPGADLEGLLQRLETVSEEQRIYRLPVFTPPFCQALLEELEHFEQSDMPKGRPNTMNNYGVREAPPGEPRRQGPLGLGRLTCSAPPSCVASPSAK